jgi:PII-like signaling protein
MEFGIWNLESGIVWNLELAMKIASEGKLLRIFVGESDQCQGRPLYEAIVLKARELGLAGATVWRGIEGYGARSRIHTSKILRLSEDLPILIEIVDTEEKIRGALDALDRLMEQAGGGGLITLEKAEIIKYSQGNS